MWGADATQLQMGSGHHRKVLFFPSISPPAHFLFFPFFLSFFFLEKENRRRFQA